MSTAGTTAAAPAPAPPAQRRRRTIPGLRWWIIGMVFMLTVINYVDRMTLAVLAPTIREEFGMTNASYSQVVTLFLLGYTSSQALSGKVLDRIGPRRGIMLFVGIWTVASMLRAVAWSIEATVQMPTKSMNPRRVPIRSSTFPESACEMV